MWGFLKYFHPQVAREETDRDDVLLRVIPGVRAAGAPEAFHAAITVLLDEAGDELPRGSDPRSAPEPDRVNLDLRSFRTRSRTRSRPAPTRGTGCSRSFATGT